MFYSPLTSFTARTTLTAEWPINSSKPDDIALNVEKLREKLIAAKFGGDDTGQPPVTTMPGIQRFAPSSPMAPTPASVRYAPAVCVQDNGLQLECTGEVNTADRRKALASAMAKAKEQASELAEAAGCHLGTLASVSGTFLQASGGDAILFNDASPVILRVGDGATQSSEVTVSVILQFHIAP
jgi:hypothetical protein